MSYVTDIVFKNTLERLRDEVMPMVRKPIATYTVIIDQNNTNPETACTYADDAVGMTKGSNDWDSMPIFKDIHPCTFVDSEVNYYLNPNDWNQQIDGGAAKLTGEDGDVMIEFAKFAYRIYTGENNMLYVTVSNDEKVISQDSRFTYDAFSRLEEGDLEHFYHGAYKGYIDADGKLRSIAGVLPTGNKTIAQFRDAAHANGPHHQQSVYAQIKAIQCLYLIKYGDRGSQAALGFGNVQNNNYLVTGYNAISVSDISAENSTAALGMDFGNKSVKTEHMRLFGIEDFWGNISEWADGLTTDASRNIITSWNSYSGEEVTPTSTTTDSGMASDFNSYPKVVQGTTDAGFMPKATNGSSSTCWADSAYLYASRVLSFGGSRAGDLRAGAFSLYAAYAASYSSALLGARHTYV